jgi:cold shock CspA family protein
MEGRISGEKIMEGTIKTLIPNKGYGFIRSGQDEYFFHRQDFNGHWDDLAADINAKERVEVEFEIVDSKKGPRASNVRRLDFPNQVG